MQNVVTVIFDVESEGYQAFTELKQNPGDAKSGIYQMVLLKKEGQNLTVCDSAGVAGNDIVKGGLIGGLIGILGGPIGVLLMGSYGMLVGSTVDAAEAVGSASMIEIAADKLQDGSVAIVALTNEEDETVLDGKLAKYKAEIYREDAAVVEKQVEDAVKLEEDLQHQAHAKMIADKKAGIEAKRAGRFAQRQKEMQEDFDRRYGQYFGDVK